MVFGIVGIPVVEVAEAIQQEGIRFVSFRNEQSCSYAASAWGYLSQQPGVCLVVSGPGVVHALAGLVNSQVNNWPLLLIGGACETWLEGAGAFQETRQTEMCRPYTKFCMRPPALSQIPQVVERAIRHSMAGRPGPAYVDLPADFIQGQADASKVPEAPRAQPTFAQADPSDIQRAVEVLSGAQRPLIIVGKGAAYSRAEQQIRQLIDKYPAPFLPTPMGKGVIPDSHLLNVSSARSLALKSADCVLLLGARVNWILHFGRRFNPAAPLIQVDVCAEEMGTNHPVAVSLQGHLPLVVQQLTSSLPGSFEPDREYMRELQEHSQRNQAKQMAKYSDCQLPMTYHRAFFEIKQLLPKDVVLVSEGANTMDIARAVFDFQQPRRRLDCATYANMGVGLGFAIAAQLHYPRQRVVAVVGDSAFGFSAMELETAVRSRLGLVVIVINNNGIYFGLDPQEYKELEQQEGKLPATALSPDVRYELVAEAVGAKGYLVRTPEELAEAVRKSLGDEGLSVINCMIKPGGYQKLDFGWMG